MHKVSAAANKVLKLPAVPSRQYSAISAVTAANFYIIGGFFKTKVLHEIKLVTNPCSENQGTKLSGRSNKTSICISQGRQ